MSIVLREKIKNDIFDYLQLTDALSSYGNIRGKIGRLLANREIIRIKKGFYTFPEYLRRAPLNPCVLANMLYGPSYVSADYALSYYGLIPERVEVITSMTKGRTRVFYTPFGDFKYFQRNSQDYSIGILCQESAESNFLIADPSKAIYDKVLTDLRFDGTDIEEYLLEDLRIDEDSLKEMDKKILHELAELSVGRMKLLVQYLQKRNTK